MVKVLKLGIAMYIVSTGIARQLEPERDLARGDGTFEWDKSKWQCRKTGSKSSISFANSETRCKNYDKCGYTISCPS